MKKLSARCICSSRSLSIDLRSRSDRSARLGLRGSQLSVGLWAPTVESFGAISGRFSAANSFTSDATFAFDSNRCRHVPSAFPAESRVKFLGFCRLPASRLLATRPNRFAIAQLGCVFSLARCSLPFIAAMASPCMPSAEPSLAPLSSEFLCFRHCSADN
jgi:hypothetical protein